MSKSRSDDSRPSHPPAASETDPGGGPDSGYASPACFLHEVDPSYLGCMGHEEVFDLLNALLAEERSIQRCIGNAAAMGLDRGHRQSLGDIAERSVRICQLAAGLIQLLGRMPAPDAGLPGEGLPEDASSTDALNKILERQRLLVAQLREALPRIPDGSMRPDLERIIGIYDGTTE